MLHEDDVEEEEEEVEETPVMEGGKTSGRGYLRVAATAVLSLLALELAALLSERQRRFLAGELVPGGLEAQALEPSAEPGMRRMSSSSSADCGETGEDSHHSKAFEPIVFFLITYILSAVAQQIKMLSPPSFRVPHSVSLFLSGMVMGALSYMVDGSEFGRTVLEFTKVDPHIIFWVLLPGLLYEDASNVKWHVMRKVIPSALLLAVPGVILNALLTGAIIKGTFGTLDWTWDTAFLLGSILSATDPVAVVGALHELAAPDRLSLLIAGESLFNDGSAVVIFSLFWDSARGVRALTPGYSIAYFIRLACGGPLLGFLFALVAFEWLKQTRKFSIEILVIFVSVYGSFFVAEHPAIKVSGVLAVVIFGFFMAARGHFALAIEEDHRHHSVIKFLALLSHEAIFVVAGVVAYRVMRSSLYDFTARDWAELVLLYIIVHGTRGLVIALCYPLLHSWGYGVSFKEAMVCVFSGLRGAVGLAMALMVEHDSRMDSAKRARIAFHTSGIVLGTLLINGTLITSFYKKLEVYQKAQYHEKLLRMALLKADSLTERRGVMFEQHWFFHNICFTELFEAVPSLVQAAEELDHHRHTQEIGKFGTSNMDTVKGQAQIHEVMTKVAYRLGHMDEDGLHDRYMQKLRFRRRWARSASNVFLPVSLASTEEDEQNHHVVIELALRMASLSHKSQDGEEEEDEDMAMFSSSEKETASKPLTPTKETRRRSNELLPPSLNPKPIVAWGDGQGQAKARLDSHVHFVDAGGSSGDASEYMDGLHSASKSQQRSPSSSTSGLPSVTALPSEMREHDQRILYRDLLLTSKNKQQMEKSHSRLEPENSRPHTPGITRPLTPGAGGGGLGKGHAPRTNLQAQRVDALFADPSFRSFGTAIQMAMLAEELKDAKTKNDRHKMAVSRWKLAKNLVIWALRTLQRALEEHAKLLEGTEKNARFGITKSMTVNSKRILSDFASMVEMYHMIVNSTRCVYTEMYEAESLPEGPFRVLMESLELQEEATDGELRSAPAARDDPKLDNLLRKLPGQPHEAQMELSFLVGWQYIVNVRKHSWSRHLEKWYRNLFSTQWEQTRHDIIMMLAFIMTTEDISEDLEVIQNFEEQVKKPMQMITESARSAVLFQVMKANPAMFYLCEHLICLRLMLDFQRHIVKDLVHDGVLLEEDGHDLITRVIQPTLDAVDAYVPTREEIRIASGHVARGSSWRRRFGSSFRTTLLETGFQKVHPEQVPEMVKEESEEWAT